MNSLRVDGEQVLNLKSSFNERFRELFVPFCATFPSSIFKMKEKFSMKGRLTA